MFQWDDLKFFLATVRARNASHAAQKLGVSTSTVTRRLIVLEESLGMVLFTRTPDGLVITDDGLEIARAAELVEKAAAELEGAAGSGQREPAGVVTLSCMTDLAQLLVIPALPELLARYPKLRLELLAGADHADLGRRDADLAFRNARPESGELTARKLRSVPFGIFASSRLIESHLGGEARLDATRVESVPWVALESSVGGTGIGRWLHDNLPKLDPVVRGASMTEVRLMATAGLGLAVLPRQLGELLPNLQQIEWGGPELPVFSLWLVANSASYRTTRVRAVWDFLIELIAETDDNVRLATIRARLAHAYGLL